MNSKKQLLAQFVLYCSWFHNALKGFSDEETNRRVSSGMNPVKYLAGHLLNSQYAFSFIAEVKLQSKWDDLFAGRGKTRAMDNFPYPTIEEIITEWDRIYPVIKNALEALPEEDLSKSQPISPVAGFGGLDNTIGDLWAFLNLHQGYHIGQIGILRRGFGKEPLNYF